MKADYDNCSSRGIVNYQILVFIRFIVYILLIFCISFYYIKYKKLTKDCIAISAILWHNIFNFIIEIVNKMTISYKEEWKYE